MKVEPHQIKDETLASAGGSASALTQAGSTPLTLAFDKHMTKTTEYLVVRKGGQTIHKAIVVKSLDKQWPKWACVIPSQCHLTKWHDAKAEAQKQADNYNNQPPRSACSY